MHPHRDTHGQPTPGLVAFAAVMRSVFRTHPDNQPTGGRVDALETWDRFGGYVLTWSTRAGVWRITAGGVPDARPLLYGPGGLWRVDADPSTHAAELTLVLLRAAGAIPRVGGPVGAFASAPAVRSAVVRGHTFTPPPEPERALPYDAAGPTPASVPAGYVPVGVSAGPGQGQLVVTMPDGSQHPYEPARRCLVPYAAGDGSTAWLMFEPAPLRLPWPGQDRQDSPLPAVSATAW